RVDEDNSIFSREGPSPAFRSAAEILRRQKIRRPAFSDFRHPAAVFVFDEFLARSLRRRAGSAGVPWPLSEAPRLSIFRDSSNSFSFRSLYLFCRSWNVFPLVLLEFCFLYC